MGLEWAGDSVMGNPGLLEKCHPVNRASNVLRAWLAMMVIAMLWIAMFSQPILFHGWIRPLPFLFLAAVGILWLIQFKKMAVVVIASSSICVGTILRALEFLIFSDYDNGPKMTGASIWLIISGTSIVIGILNVLVMSRITAEEWVWGVRSSAIGGENG